MTTFPSVRHSMRPAVALVCALFLAFPVADRASADTITLKNGNKIEGRILEEKPDYVKIEVQVTESIRETKFVKREEIAGVEKVKPDEVAFEKMQKILPTPDLMTTGEYDKLILLQPQRFLTDFPNSARKAEVEKILATLEEEKGKVVAGGVKLDGEWVTPEQIKADPYNHQANVLLARMRTKIGESDYTNALKGFERLQADYAYAKAHATGVDVARRSLGSYERQLNGLVAKHKFEAEERERDLKAMTADERVKTEAAIKEELENFDARWKAAKQAKETWLPISVWNEKSLTDALKVVESERKRLEGIDVEAITTQSVRLALAFKAFSEGEYAQAEVQVGRAKEAGVRGAVIDTLLKNAQTAKAEQEAAIVAERTRRPESDPDPAKAEEPETSGKNEKASAPKTETPAEKKEPEAPKKTEPAKTASNVDLGLDDGDGGDEERAEEKKGPPIGVIIGILAGIMVVFTVLAKAFGTKGGSDRVEEDGEEAREEG